MVFRIAAPKRALGEYASVAKDWEGKLPRLDLEHYDEARPVL